MGQKLKEDDITKLRAHVSRIMKDTTNLRQSLQINNRVDYLDKVKVGSVHHASHLTSHAPPSPLMQPLQPPGPPMSPLQPPLMLFLKPPGPAGVWVLV